MTCLENASNFVKMSKEELSIEWRIPNFFSFSDEDDIIVSPYFHFCGVLWYLELWPAPDIEESDPYSGTATLILKRKSYPSYEILLAPPETIHFMFGVRGSEGVEMKKEDKQEFSGDFSIYSCPNFLSRSELKNHESRLVPNDVLTITFELKKNAHGSARGVENLQKSLRSMLMTGHDCDIKIKVQGNEFPCHKGILCARSPIFRAMFSHNMVENQSGIVAIDDCDPQTFSDFLDHVYTGSSEKINMGNALNLYMVSDKYEMDTLKEQCVECIKRHLSVPSFYNVMKLALKHDDKALIEFATQFFCNNSSDIVTTSEWQSFYEENSAVGYNLFIKALTK